MLLKRTFPFNFPFGLMRTASVFDVYFSHKLELPGCDSLSIGDAEKKKRRKCFVAKEEKEKVKKKCKKNNSPKGKRNRAAKKKKERRIAGEPAVDFHIKQS